MRNVLRIVARDFKRLAKAPAAWLVLAALMVLPSLYAWLNIYAFWSPYEHAYELTVCVVNEDEGTDDETLGHLDIGSKVVDELKENHELGWTFTDYDTAMHEINTGEAFAAFLIPKDFSADVATLLSPDFVQPKLVYYANEKEGPIATKITDVGADTLDETINDAFFSTVSSTIAKTLNEKTAQADEAVESARDSAVVRLTQSIDDAAQARETLQQISGSTQDAVAKIDAARGRLESAKEQLGTVSSGVSDIAQLAGETNSALVSVSGEMNSALDSLSTDLSQVSRDLTLALVDTSEAIKRAKEAADALPIEDDQWRRNLEALEQATSSSVDAAESANQLIANTLARTDVYRQGLQTQTVPALSQSLTQIASTAAQLSATIESQKILVDEAYDVLGQMRSTLEISAGALDETAGVLQDIEEDLQPIRTDVQALQGASTISSLFGSETLDPEQIASFMQSPTRIKTEELYPLNAFGSAMAPLFINLTLWIGVFMLMVIMHLEVDPAGLQKPTATQRYFGRLALLAPFAMGQAAVCCTGCLLLGVQMQNVALFYLSAIVASLSYLCIQYTLSVTFQHVGKALCVILVFMQIPGASGLYPIEMIPDFYQAVYPLFPFTYSIDALRETICGFYDGVWVRSLLTLVGFAAAFIAIGVVVRPYVTNLNRLFAREIRESGLINAEAIQLPARRWRMSQLLAFLANQDEYRQKINVRLERFIKWYPQLKRFTILVGGAFIVVLTAVLFAFSVEKPIILTTWLAWFVLMIAFYTTLEYMRDHLSHFVSLDDMSEDQVKALAGKNQGLTNVEPIKDVITRSGKSGKGGSNEGSPS